MIRNIQHGFRIFSDVVGILFALGYCISIGFMLLFKMGEPLLNYMLLALTGVFLLFLILKLVLLKDKPKKSGKVSKYGKRTYKYIKHIMRLVNAVMIVVSVVNVNVWNGSVVAPLVTMFINIAGFLFMILFDVLTFLVKRKISKKRDERKNRQKLVQVQEQEANKNYISPKKNISAQPSAKNQSTSTSLNQSEPSPKKPRTSLKQLIATAREALEINPNPKDNQ